MTIAEKLTQIAENEPKVFEAGYEKGKAEGGYTEGFNAGKQLEYDAFWDAYQQNGTQKNYLGAFSGKGWKAETFKPKYPITTTDGAINGTQMFFHHGVSSYDFVKHCKENNIVIDFSCFNYLTSCFAYSAITTLGDIDFKSVTTAIGTYGWNGAFTGCQSLHTIRKLVFYETNPEFHTGMFTNCSNLENITIDGVIAKNGLNLQWSTKLSKASYESIRDHTTVMVPISITFSLKGVNKTYETSEGANDGSTSDEWVNLWKSMGNVTIALA